jgi:hypothetical protein
MGMRAVLSDGASARSPILARIARPKLCSILRLQELLE